MHHPSPPVQIITMQQLISQIPELHSYLAQVPPKEHHLALAEVVRAGLSALRVPNCCQQYSCQYGLPGELDRIKENIESLNQQVKNQCAHLYRCCRRQVEAQQRDVGFVSNVQPTQDHAVSFGQKQHKRAKDTTAKFKDENVMTVPYNPFARKRQGDPRLLDDKQVREALTFPDDPNGPRTTAVQMMRRSSLEHNQHKYQPEIDKEEKVRLRGTKAEEEQQQTLRGRSRTGYNHIQSKIKARAERDRAIYQQQQKQLEEKKRYQMYEYSDENQMEESSIRAEEYSQQQQFGQQEYPHPQHQHRSSNEQRYYDQLTYNQQYQSSFRDSHPATSSKKGGASSQKSRRSSEQKGNNGFERSSSQRQAVSQLEGASDNKSRQSGQPSGNKELPQAAPVFPPAPGPQAHPPAEQDDDVISNSSSFSQFSISSSRRKQVGKISRRRA